MANKSTAAFILGLIGGVFILINAIAFNILSSFMGGILAGFGGGASGSLNFLNFTNILLWVSAFAVLIGSIMHVIKTEMHKIWGILVLVFSLVAVVGGGGFFIGTILGLVGGILGIVSKPAVSQAPPRFGA